MLSPVRTALLLAALGLPLSLSHTSLAQPPAAKPVAKEAPAVDPAAKDFIDKFRAAVKGINDVSCTVVQAMTTGDKTDRQSGDLVAVFARTDAGRATLKQFKITSKREGLDGVWSFDGSTAFKIDNAKKTFASMESPDGVAFPVPDVSMIVPTWIYGSDVLSNPGAKLVAARFLPDAKVDGVNCRVVEYRVEVTLPDAPSEDAAKDAKPEPRIMTMLQTRHVGAADLVARKIESHTSTSGVPDDQPRTFTAAYTNVKVNTQPSAETFVLKSPDGFTVAKARASALGVPSNEPDLNFDVGDVAPAFTLKSASGPDVSLASLKGRVVLLDFWATWCGPCKMAMPGVQKLHEKYAGKAVSVFGVDTFERGKPEKRVELSTKYMADKKYTYGLLFDGDALAKEYGITGIPTFIVIGADGKILHLGVGFDEAMDEKIATIIDKALAGK